MALHPRFEPLPLSRYIYAAYVTIKLRLIKEAEDGGPNDKPDVNFYVKYFNNWAQLSKSPHQDPPLNQKNCILSLHKVNIDNDGDPF
jgi:hypothetical protein